MRVKTNNVPFCTIIRRFVRVLNFIFYKKKKKKKKKKKIKEKPKFGFV
jgi:hypothetical protein